MTKVTLREKKISKGMVSLYLDFYPPVINPATGKLTRRDFLKLYIHAKPKTETERDFNKETRMLAENVRAQRQLDLQAGGYGFVSSKSRQKSFIDFLETIRAGKSEVRKWHWKSVIDHLELFAGDSVRFGDITRQFCNDFREYLLDKSRSKISVNTAAIYFGSFKSAVSDAYDNKLLSENISKLVKNIKTEETSRNFLTLEELIRLVDTPVACEPLRKAAVFSALTELRFSDIKKLTWLEIQKDQDGAFIRFRQKKTKGAEIHPISDDALQIVGERRAAGDPVIPNLQKWQCEYYLAGWIVGAGIERPITFHSFRHSYAFLQLSGGTDIYTLSKLLGHRNLATTQIYARAIDTRKREAANKIKLK